ncbi:MAG: aminopeptidase [Desulfomonilaceae bacterium]
MAEKKGSKKTQQLKEQLAREPRRCWDAATASEQKEILAYCEKYKDFLNRARTERMAVRVITDMAEKEGYLPLSERTSPGQKVSHTSRGKFVALAVLGQKPLTEGMRIITSHIDSPRLDLKPNPLFEEAGLAFLKTHYYGGIKKYHWVGRPLALCGTVIKADGRAVEVELGVAADEPVFTIPDLLPHLSRKMMDQKASEFIPGENLNLIVGGKPYPDKEAGDRVKLAILEILHHKYGLKEEDLIGAEIEVVPAEPARDAGLDGSLILGYGQDDRVCAYTALTAILGTKEPEHTAVAVFYDKEEVGSEGNTSAKSRVLEMFLMDLMDSSGVEPTTRAMHHCLYRSKALSADVTAAFDPTYPDVYEKRNCAFLGYGINLTKYTGHGGKYMASEANAEYMHWVKKLFNDNHIVWQAGDLGKIDEGGGGTVAKYLANCGMEIIDCGPALLGMHSPMELSSKDDVWMCHKAFQVFFTK